MTLKLSAEDKMRIASRLPEGYDVETLRFVNVTAVATPLDSLSEAERNELLAAHTASAGMNVAGVPLLSGDLPNVMRVVAWLTHEGENENGDEFRAADLGPSADRIRLPHAIPMDWNHSAAIPWSEHPKAIGFWYSAEKRWDEKAKAGEGAYGILAQGTMWSWLFPDYATEMLAEQQRLGHIRFSMACLSKGVEIVTKADGRQKAVLIEPIFMTLSALDVKNADADANGLGKEGDNASDVEQKLTEQLTSAGAKDTPMSPSADLEDEDMDELKKLIAALEGKIENFAAVNEAVTKLADATQAQADLETQVAELTQKLADANAKIEAAATVEGELADTKTALDAVKTEAEQLKQAAEAVNVELTEAKEKLAAFEAEVEKQAAEQKLAARLAELPAAYLAKHTAKVAEQKEKDEQRWLAKSDEDWSAFVADIKPAFEGLKLSFLKLSQDEGTVSTAVTGEGDEMEKRLAALKR